MSKVVITLDTKDNTLQCNIDGESLDNVSSASVERYNYDEKSNLYFCIYLDDAKIGNDSDIRRKVRIANASDNQAISAVKSGKGSISEDKTMIVHEVSNVNLDGLLGRKNTKN